MYSRSEETGRLKRTRSIHVLSPSTFVGKKKESLRDSQGSPGQKMSTGASAWIKRNNEDENLVLVVEDWKKKKKTGSDLLKELKQFMGAPILHKVTFLNLKNLATFLHNNGVDIDLDAENPLINTFKELLGMRVPGQDPNSSTSSSNFDHSVDENAARAALRDVPKLYENENKHYGGVMQENIDDFKRTFMYRLDLLNVPLSSRAGSIEFPLKDMALDYYIEHLKHKVHDLNQIFDKMKEYFRSGDRHSRMVQIYSGPKFSMFYKDGATGEMALNELYKRAKVLQKGLPEEYHSDRLFMGRLLGAVSGEPFSSKLSMNLPGTVKETMERLKMDTSEQEKYEEAKRKEQKSIINYAQTKFARRNRGKERFSPSTRHWNSKGKQSWGQSKVGRKNPRGKDGRVMR